MRTVPWPSSLAGLAAPLHGRPVFLHLRPDSVHRRVSSSVVSPILMEGFGWGSATVGTSLSGFGALVWLLFASGEQVFE